MQSSIPYINSLIEKFWFIVINNRSNSPNFTDLLNLCESIILADGKDKKENKEHLKQINFIRSNTHKDILMPSASFELWVNRNWKNSINKELSFRDGKILRLYQIVETIDNVVKDLCEIVTEIGKKYTMHIIFEEEDKPKHTGNIFSMIQ